MNPVNNRLIRSFPFASQQDILKTIARSADAFHKYKHTSIESRIEKVNEFSKVLESN